ncbi:hypothetical protein RJ640_020069 [Escallonia rubra]|uniref:Uncharacterized protein n=1 Tax=Escallonia rubra TaxID=112253 RepID=A0AA88ULE3_9ASTE|nr:hypothetical protein RJ640_020069 [Escallonia rubra]
MIPVGTGFKGSACPSRPPHNLPLENQKEESICVWVGGDGGVSLQFDDFQKEDIQMVSQLREQGFHFYGGRDASQSVKKIIEIDPYMLGTMAEGAADCQFWHRNLGINARDGFLCRTIIAGWDEKGPGLYNEEGRLKAT